MHDVSKMKLWAFLWLAVVSSDTVCGDNEGITDADDTIADTHTLLQVQQLVRGQKNLHRQAHDDENLPQDEKPTAATTLLSQVKTMAFALKQEQEDPIRQCIGGWRTGAGSGGAEQSVGVVANKTKCLSGVRSQCPNSTGASYNTSTRHCYCNFGQQRLDSSVTGKEHCEFFQRNSSDHSLDLATTALESMVNNILQAIQHEQDAAFRMSNNSWDSVVDAFTLVNATHSASTLRRLQEQNLTKYNQSEQCVLDLAYWKGQKATTCPAWEAHAQSLSSCSQACPCQTSSDNFYSSYLVWRNIISNGGGAQIEAVRGRCMNASAHVENLTTACPRLAAEAVQAHAVYVATVTHHTDSCHNYGSVTQLHASTAAELAISLEQRNNEYCVALQVQCFLRLIRNATVNGTLMNSSDMDACSGPRQYVQQSGGGDCPSGYSALTTSSQCSQIASSEGLSYNSGSYYHYNSYYGYVPGCSVGAQFTHDHRRRRDTLYWVQPSSSVTRRRTSMVTSYQICRNTNSHGCGTHFNITFPQVPELPECVVGLQADKGAPKAFDYVDSVCAALAPGWEGGENCSTSGNLLNWNDWYQKDGHDGYWQVVTKHPEVFVKFSVSVSRGPAFKIKYSDNGKTWSTAATVSSASYNPHVEWPPSVGAHRHWRFVITGDWSTGPWYKDLQFYTPTSTSELMHARNQLQWYYSGGYYCLSTERYGTNNYGCNRSTCLNSSSSDAFTKRCNTSSLGQMFYRNSTTQQFRSSYGTNRCLSARTSDYYTSDCVPLTMRTCDSSDEQQQFVAGSTYSGDATWYVNSRRRYSQRYIRTEYSWASDGTYIRACYYNNYNSDQRRYRLVEE